MRPPPISDWSKFFDDLVMVDDELMAVCFRRLQLSARRKQQHCIVQHVSGACGPMRTSVLLLRSAQKYIASVRGSIACPDRRYRPHIGSGDACRSLSQSRPQAVLTLVPERKALCKCTNIRNPFSCRHGRVKKMYYSLKCTAPAAAAVHAPRPICKKMCGRNMHKWMF